MARVDQLWRYPVTSMPGEQVERAVVGPEGLLGDRALAVVAADDGAVVAVTEPRSGSGLLDFRARYSAEPEPGAPLPPVDVHFPDGSTLRTDDERIHAALSGALGREVRLSADPGPGALAAEAGPGVEGSASPADRATLHLLATGTLAAVAPQAGFDARRHRPNVLVDTGPDAGSGAGDPSAGDPSVGDPSVGDPSVGDPSVGDPGGGAVEEGWVGRTVTAGEVGLRVLGPGGRAGVHAAVATPGTVAVGDPVSVD